MCSSIIYHVIYTCALLSVYYTYTAPVGIKFLFNQWSDIHWDLFLFEFSVKSPLNVNAQYYDIHKYRTQGTENRGTPYTTLLSNTNIARTIAVEMIYRPAVYGNHQHKKVTVMTGEWEKTKKPKENEKLKVK